MDIYLSVNNREDVIKLPVLPEEFTVTKPQGGETFETVSKGELRLIGEPKLKTIAIESFFPAREYSFLRDDSMKGFEYVYKIDTWIKEKLPIRLTITDTPINMACGVDNFEYTVKQDKDLWYKLELSEFNLLEELYQTAEAEEEINMEELEALKQEVQNLKAVVEELANPVKWNWMDENIPYWSAESVQKAMDAGVLTLDPVTGGFDLDYDLLRVLVWMNRAGCLHGNG